MAVQWQLHLRERAHPAWQKWVGLLLLSLLAAPVGAARQAGAGLTYTLSDSGGCENAAWILPAADAVRDIRRRSYKPERNRALEATLLAGAAHAAPSAKLDGTRRLPSLADLPVRGRAAASASPEQLARAVVMLMADPAGLDPVLSATVRGLTLLAPTNAVGRDGGAPSAPANASSAATAAAEGGRPSAGTYELRVEYTCLSLESYNSTIDATLRMNALGSTVWVDGLVLPPGAAVPSNEVGSNVLLAVDGISAGTPPLACGTAVFDSSAVRTAPRLGLLAKARSWAVGEHCRAAAPDAAARETSRLECSRAAIAGQSVQAVFVDPAVEIFSSVNVSDEDLLAGAVGHPAPAAVPAAAQRLRLWEVGNGIAGGSSLRAAATAATAREAVSASAEVDLPRLEPPLLLILFTLLPAIASFVLAGLSFSGVVLLREEALLRRERSPAEDLRRRVFVVEQLSAGLAVAGSVVLLKEFGNASARGYVAIEEGGVLLRETSGPVLVVTAVPVVEGVLVRLGSNRDRWLVVFALVLAVVVLSWNVVYVGLSVGAGWRRRLSAAASTSEEYGSDAGGDDGGREAVRRRVGTDS